MANFCSACGGRLRPLDKFCPTCGSRASAEGDSQKDSFAPDVVASTLGVRGAQAAQSTSENGFMDFSVQSVLVRGVTGAVLLALFGFIRGLIKGVPYDSDFYIYAVVLGTLLGVFIKQRWWIISCLVLGLVVWAFTRI